MNQSGPSFRDLRMRFIGAGNMASSLIGGLIRKGLTASQISASDPEANQRAWIEREFQVRTHSDNSAHFGAPDVIVLAVKPQVMRPVLQAAGAVIANADALIMSVAAGITTEQIQRWIGAPLPVVRTMPNTPALIGQGAIGMFANARVDARQRFLSEQIMDAVGTAIWVDDESDIDAVTAVSGSGPAYFFLLMECLQAAAESLGLNSEEAALLVKKTATGAALLAERSPESLAQLRARVTSPNGTTERALNCFAEDHFDAIIARAVQAARARSVELSAEFNDPGQ